MKINITDEHIAKGRHSHPHFCPIALAIKDLIKPEYNVWVNAITAIQSGNNCIASQTTTRRQWQFIEDYEGDCITESTPRDFEFYIPEECLKEDS